MASTVSFKFSKSSKKAVVIRNQGAENENIENTDTILSIEGKEIESAHPKKEKKKELIIPLIHKNNWRKTADGDKSNQTEEEILSAKAAAELLEEISKDNEKWKHRYDTDSNVEIPLIMRNMVPEGFETDDKLDVSLRPDVSSMNDYESVPIEQFGKAMLRGMGWKKDEGIGGRNKQVVKPIEAVARPKGLGLGADPKLVQEVKSGGKDSDIKQEFIKGGYVKVHHGPHRDLYGEVEGVDEDNSRVNVVMTLSGKKLTLSKFILTVVSKKEYKKESKVINKEKYMDYVKKKDEEHHREREKRKHEDESNGHQDQRKHHKKRKDDHSSDSHKKSTEVKFPWVQPFLRVRFIDKKYKGGKYYNSKVTVEDVVSTTSCICQTETGRLLEDVNPDKLETVIPKNENANVMIVGHETYKNKLGKIMKRDKSKCRATVRLLEDQSLVKLHFDSICEYIGELPDYL